MFRVRSSGLFALAMLLVCTFASPLQAQISTQATPYSALHTTPDRPATFSLAPVTILPRHADQYYDPSDDLQGFYIVPPYRHGFEIPVDLGLHNAGHWQSLPDGGRLWRLRIASLGAQSLNLVYDDFFLPEGAQLFLYNDDRSTVLGAFTSQNNKTHGGFATALVPG
ncbi:MAG: hypothetical protein ACE5G0_19860, partial [Rhodothermales bacterium]